MLKVVIRFLKKEIIDLLPSTRNKITIPQLKTELQETKQKLQQESDTLNYTDHWIHQNLTKPVAQKIQTKIIEPLRKKPILTRELDKEQVKQFYKNLKYLDDPFRPFKFEQ